MNDAASAMRGLSPVASSSGMRESCSAGFVIAPSARVQTVMPSCDPASRSVSSEELRNAARTLRQMGITKEDALRLLAQAWEEEET